jgi:ABC-2 type transport system permease protein
MFGGNMKISNILSRRNRILLRELVITDFKLRYQGSVLGYAWSVLKPLFLFAILFVVFDQFLRLGRNIENFPIYLLLGIVLWTFFAEATNLGLQSIISRGDLIRKINFPKYIIVVSGTVSSLINLILNLLVVFVFTLFSSVHISWEMVLLVPLIIELYVFALAVAFFLAALNVKLRDVGYLWEIFMQAAFYATPVLYPLQMVYAQHEFVARILLINPVAQIIQDARYVVVTHDSLTVWGLFHDWKVILPFVVIGITLVLAVTYFKRNSKRFAEDI